MGVGSNSGVGDSDKSAADAAAAEAEAAFLWKHISARRSKVCCFICCCLFARRNWSRWSGRRATAAVEKLGRNGSIPVELDDFVGEALAFAFAAALAVVTTLDLVGGEAEITAAGGAK